MRRDIQNKYPGSDCKIGNHPIPMGVPVVYRPGEGVACAECWNAKHPDTKWGVMTPENAPKGTFSFIMEMDPSKPIEERFITRGLRKEQPFTLKEETLREMIVWAGHEIARIQKFSGQISEAQEILARVSQEYSIPMEVLRKAAAEKGKFDKALGGSVEPAKEVAPGEVPEIK